MSEFIGVKSPVSLFYSPSLKREALLFDRIVIPQFTDFLAKNRDTDLIRQEVPDLEWLMEKGIIIESEPLRDDSILGNKQFRENWEAYSNTFAEASNLFGDYQRNLPSGEIGEQLDRLTVYQKGMLTLTDEAVDLISFWEGLHEKALLSSDYLARLVSIQLRVQNSMDAQPILDSDFCLGIDEGATKTDVIDVVLKSLPVPDDLVAWEQILEYRSDPDARGKFLALRRWMNKIARENISVKEIQDELEFLIHEYQSNLKLHRMKVNSQTWQAILIAHADFIPNLVKLKWGDIAQSLFTLKHRRIALMELELTAPGNEVAYIAEAQETFENTF